MTKIEGMFAALEYATEAATKADCPRGQVGAAIVDKYGEVLGVGYNERAKAFGPCNCDCGTDTLTSGSSTCQTTHAEVMAILDVQSIYRTAVYAMACTRAPCHRCLNLLACTAIKHLIVRDEFPDRDESERRWLGMGREWHWIGLTHPI